MQRRAQACSAALHHDLLNCAVFIWIRRPCCPRRQRYASTMVAAEAAVEVIHVRHIYCSRIAVACKPGCDRRSPPASEGQKAAVIGRCSRKEQVPRQATKRGTMALRVNATAAQYACGTLGQVGATPLRLVITEGSTRAIEAASELVCMLTLLLIVSLIFVVTAFSPDAQLRARVARLGSGRPTTSEQTRASMYSQGSCRSATKGGSRRANCSKLSWSAGEGAAAQTAGIGSNLDAHQLMRRPNCFLNKNRAALAERFRVEEKCETCCRWMGRLSGSGRDSTRLAGV